ncbi:MAG: DUF6178 family protein [Myxococcota bacterium]
MSDEEGKVVPLEPWHRIVGRAQRGVPSVQELERTPQAVAKLSELDAYGAVKALGSESAAPLLRWMTPEQRSALFDLESWDGDRLAPAEVLSWLEAFREAGSPILQEVVSSLDVEFLAGLVARRLYVASKPSEDTRAHELPDWLANAGDDLELIETPDRRFVLAVRPHEPGEEEEGLEEEGRAMVRLVEELYLHEDHETVIQVLRTAETDLLSDLEETSFRFRTARLEDLGFPTVERAFEMLEPLGTLDQRDMTTHDTGRGPIPNLYSQFMTRGRWASTLAEAHLPRLEARVESEIPVLVQALMVIDRVKPSDFEGVRRCVTTVLGWLDLGLGSESEATGRLETRSIRDLVRFGFGRTRSPGRRLKGLRSSGSFDWGGTGGLEPPFEEGIKALLAPRPSLAGAVLTWPSPGPSPAESRPLLSMRDLDRAEAFVDHVEGWLEAETYMGLRPAVEALTHPAILPAAIDERGWRTALATGVCWVALGQPFSVKPFGSEDLERLAVRTAASRPEELQALFDKLACDWSISRGAAEAIQRELGWGLSTVWQQLPALASRGIDVRFVEGLFRIASDP